MKNNHLSFSIIVLIILSIFLIQSCRQTASEKDCSKNSGTDWKAETSYDITPHFHPSDSLCFCINGESNFKISSVQTKNKVNGFQEVLGFFADAAFDGTHKKYSSGPIGIPDFIDTLSNEQFYSYIRKSDNNIPKSAITALRFNQEWYYDKKKKKIVVKVTDAGLMLKKYSDSDEFLGYQGLCYFKFENRTSDAVPDQLYSLPEILWAKSFPVALNFDSVNPGNIIQPASSGWCESIKIQFNKELPQILFEEVIAGNVDVYPAKTDGSPDFSRNLSESEIKKLITFRDTVYTENPQTGEMDMKVTDHEISPENILKIRINQSWDFDKKQFRMTSKITSTAVLKDNYLMGEVKNSEPLFWIKF